uniref:Uncharacterized mitochondrial protein AtMg00810-like n=1 Tax=Tanacetum cinerariifolium TaxID=118510 RepID=A0A6L2JK42_TANCI|nr:uncharacterized mitochondrial protein AtMg00810-like [Tanacetum cinerariifolium]
MKIKESLNVTFDETPSTSKTSPLVDDNLDKDQAIKIFETKNLENDIEDETLKVDEIVNIEEPKNHLLENVIENLNQITLRPDIMFSICLCPCFQDDPKTSHLEAVKLIFRYIKGTPHLGLWYPKRTGIETIVYANSDHARDYVDRKSTSVESNEPHDPLFDELYSLTKMTSAEEIRDASLNVTKIKVMKGLHRNGDLPVPDLRTIEELCQPSLNGRGGPIASIVIQATNFGLKNNMIQQVHNSCQFHGGTFMKRCPEECYDLIENMTAHHNNWDISGQHSQNQPLAYQAPAYQAPAYQAPVHQPQIPQPQVVTTNEFTNFMKANNAILKNMQTNMTSLKNSNLELKNMFVQFMKINTTSSSSSRTLPSNTITNPKEDLKGITTRSETACQGPTIPTTSSSPVVERETEATKDTVHPTNNGSTEDVQPLVVQTESPILNSEPAVAPIIEPVV